MLFDLLKLVGGLVVLIAGAEVLVRGAAGLALRMGIPALIVGLTIVAFGTSSPELVVCIKDTLNGSGQLALGAVIGSNICNVLLILGVSGLIAPIAIHRDLFKLDLPVMIFSSFLLAGLLAMGGLTRITGAILLLLLGSYIFLTIRNAKRNAAISKDAALVHEEEDIAEHGSKAPVWALLIMILLGPVLLSFGADLLLQGGRNIATQFGVSEAVIGLTLVAFGSSLPELATAIVAAIRRNPDIVVGNVIGSNIFNVLCVLGCSSVVPFLSAASPGSTSAPCSPSP